MQQTVQRIEKKQKTDHWVIVGIAVGMILLTVLIVYISKGSKEHGYILVKRLEMQNKQLEKQNLSLIETIEKLNLTVEESVRQDSTFLVLTNEQLQLLPGIDYKVTTIKTNYEKNAVNYRNLDARAVESYIAEEARRLRNE